METSRFAYNHLPAVMYASPSTRGPSFPKVFNDASDTDAAARTYDPLLWLMRWVLTFALGRPVTGRPLAHARTGMSYMKSNRQNRRYVSRATFGAERDGFERRVSFYRILARGLTSRQCQEKKARLFPHGRVRIYGLRYWGTALQTRARLSCYDHGSWRMPLTSAVAQGMWDVQLPPN